MLVSSLQTTALSTGDAYKVINIALSGASWSVFYCLLRNYRVNENTTCLSLMLVSLILKLKTAFKKLATCYMEKRERACSALLSLSATLVELRVGRVELPGTFFFSCYHHLFVIFYLLHQHRSTIRPINNNFQCD